MDKQDDKQENNVDIAIQELRKLQQMIFSFDKSDQDLFNYTNEIIKTMEKASKEIKTNYEDISRKLTDLWNGKKTK